MKKKQFVSFSGTVSEMAEAVRALEIKVPLAKGVNIKKLVKNDKDPMFVTIEALNTSVSKSKRKYTPAVIQEIAKQINANKPDAYEGHLTESERGTKRPKPQTIWLGAAVKSVGGKMRLFVKGYVLPYAKELKGYLRAAQAAGKKVAVSIYGQAKQVWDGANKVYNMSEFRLESIDWARSGSEGVPTLGYLALASEMKGEKLMNREEIIKSLKFGELEEFNSKLVSEMRGEIGEELKEAVEAEFKENKDSELGLIREMLGAKKKVELAGVVSEMKDELDGLRQEKADRFVESSLAKRVQNKAARKVLKSMVVREMEGEYNLKVVGEIVNKTIRSKEGKAVVKEMLETRTIVTPLRDNRKKGKGRKYTVIK